MAAASNRMSTRWSLSRFTSSIYRMPRWVAAISPGSKIRLPVLMASSMSREPTSLSSVAPTGRSTIGICRTIVCALLFAGSQREQRPWRSSGLQLYAQPWTTVTSGSSDARERTAVDLAVPFLPRTNTPPILGFTAFSSSALFIATCPTIAVNGNRVSISPTWVKEFCSVIFGRFI